MLPRMRIASALPLCLVGLVLFTAPLRGDEPKKAEQPLDQATVVAALEKDGRVTFDGGTVVATYDYTVDGDSVEAIANRPKVTPDEDRGFKDVISRRRPNRFPPGRRLAVTSPSGNPL